MNKYDRMLKYIEFEKNVAKNIMGHKYVSLTMTFEEIRIIKKLLKNNRPAQDVKPSR